MKTGERKLKASEFETLCKNYSKKYGEYIKSKRELEQNDRTIEDIQQRIHLNDNKERLPEINKLEEDLKQQKELDSKIEKQLKRENTIAFVRWGIAIVVGVLLYFTGVSDKISSTDSFRIGLFLFVFCLCSFVAWIFAKTKLKKHSRWCIVIMLVLFVIVFLKIIDLYGLSGTTIPIKGTALAICSNIGVCTIGISLVGFLWGVVVQGKWEDIKEKKSKTADDIKQIDQKIKVKRCEDSLNEQWESIQYANQDRPRPEDVKGKLVDNLYMVDWEYNSELPPPMTHIENASEPMVFLYHWDDKSKEPELLNNFILKMTGTIILFNCLDLIEIKVVDFILNNNTIRTRELKKLAELVKLDKVKEVISGLSKDKQGENGTLIEHNQKELQNTLSKEYKKYKIIQFIISTKNMIQYKDIWGIEWWEALTSAKQYGYLPIFYVEQEAFKNEKTDFMKKFKEYTEHYSIYEIKDDMYCEKKESIEQ